MSKRERNPVQIGIIGLVVAAALVVAGLQYDRLQFIAGGVRYQAYFADAGGLLTGDYVTVAGVNVGKVEKVELDGADVRVGFSMDEGIQLGDSTRADIKTNTILGRKSLEVTPEGAEIMPVGSSIPLDRTNSPYSLNDALGDLSTTVSELDTDQLNNSLNAMSDALADTPPELRTALTGISRLSASINARDESLRDLLARAESVTKILADRSDQINALVVDGNQLLGELDRRRNAISELITNISAVSRQLTGLVQDNEQQMKPTLDKLNATVDILQRNKDNIGQALDGLGPYATALGESVSSGPFFMAYVANFQVGAMTQTFVDSLLWPEHVPKDLQQFPPLTTELKDPNR
ncbi:MCE family protein [Rhodococcus olei]|uniref:MCE family protein n=1 Tax=Rhodococcus olei TaxID=2161675 RepID=A0ABP8PQS6_9NOCA